MKITFFSVICFFAFFAEMNAKPLTLLSPTGGERFPVDGTLFVRWETSDSGIVQVLPKISFDNGWSYFNMTEDPIDKRISPDWENFEYRIPAYYIKTIRPGEDTLIYTISDSCIILIQDYLGSAVDVIGNVFSIYDESKIEYRHMARSRALSIWPNPATSFSELRFQAGAVLQGPLACYDLSGRLIAFWNIASREGLLPTAKTIPAGVYVFKALQNDKKVTTKLIIK